ncbi:MAG TPA: glycosyltransferase [Pyrinomonadaceae bacterium]|nr:glycosyltransferase [Pyrinomonadaceae bacterium]
MLYLCYFGLREPLVQTQVLPYLRQLVTGGVNVNLLTFEPRSIHEWPEREREKQKQELEGEGINWFWLPYHKRPSLPATAYDILAGACMAARLARRYHLDVLHARAHVAMAMAMLARTLTECRLVFDLRGLIAEEYADAGIWTEGSLPFRMVKRLERAGLRRANEIIVLTRRVRDWLIERGLASADKIEVIPCCVDLSRFNAHGETWPPAAQDRFEVVYAGSVTGLYMLEEMGRFFLEIKARREDAFLRILTVSGAQGAKDTLCRVGLKVEDFWVGAVAPAEVPLYLSRARMGLSFRKPAFSQIAASPTKIAEYLAAGLPVVSNAGTGDTDELLEGERLGVILRDFSREGYERAAGAALALTGEPDIRARCMEAARRHFDMVKVGGERYRHVYARLKEREAKLPTISKASQ